MQRFKLSWHEKVLGIDILRVELCDPLDYIALLLEKEFVFLLFLRLTKVLSRNELFDKL